jgi:hypothetical protein
VIACEGAETAALAKLTDWLLFSAASYPRLLGKQSKTISSSEAAQYYSCVYLALAGALPKQTQNAMVYSLCSQVSLSPEASQLKY